MEDLYTRFPVIAEEILSNLTSQCLADFKTSSKVTDTFLNQGRLYWITMIRKYNNNFVEFKESWNKSIDKTPVDINWRARQQIVRNILLLFLPMLPSPFCLYSYFMSEQPRTIEIITPTSWHWRDFTTLVSWDPEHQRMHVDCGYLWFSPFTPMAP